MRGEKKEKIAKKTKATSQLGEGAEKFKFEARTHPPFNAHISYYLPHH